jgi:hypothetical protein
MELEAELISLMFLDYNSYLKPSEMPGAIIDTEIDLRGWHKSSRLVHFFLAISLYHLLINLRDVG